MSASTVALRGPRVSDPRFAADGLAFVTVRSAALGRRVDLSLYVPEGTGTVPLAILLHGVHGSHWHWPLRAGAHLTARRLIERGEIPPLALAMPSDGLEGDGSGYLGRDLERWIVDEVPALVATLRPELIDAGSPLLLGGLSMGGFGALRLGALHAERFAAISAHSAITRLEQLAVFSDDALFVDPALADDERDAAACLLRAGKRLPPLRFDCGREDPLLEANRELHRRLEAAGIGHRFEEFPGGHEWSYWEDHLADTLRFFAAALRG